MGSFAIEKAGGQNHQVELIQIFERMKKSFKTNVYRNWGKLCYKEEKNKFNYYPMKSIN